MYAGPGGHRGEYMAGIRCSAKPSWHSRSAFPSGAARVATAGDVMFYGTMDGWFKAD